MSNKDKDVIKSSMKNTALYVAALVFALMAALHIFRLYAQATVVVNGHEIPYWANGVGAVISSLLAAWMILAAACNRHCHNHNNINQNPHV